MAACAFSCHGICRKKQIHRGAPGKKHTSPPEATSHNNSYDLAYFFIGINVIIRQAHNFIMCKGIKPSSHCLHLPFLPTPHTFHAVASSLLLVPRNFTTFTAPTAANIGYNQFSGMLRKYVLHSQYQLLKPTALSSSTSKQAGEFFCLQVSSTSDEQQSENPTHLPVAASNCLSSAIFRPLFAGHLASLAGSYFPDTCFHTFHRNGDRKVHA